MAAGAFGTFFTIRISMPRVLAALQLHVVHEAANQEDPAAARFENVFGRQRVGDLLGIESLAFIFHADHELFGIVRPARG